jgi:hypothetical protein
VLVLGCFGLAAVILWELAHFPGLESDEAWFGLAAHDILDHGVLSLSGMTWYTGNLYPALVAGAFALLGEGVLQLRLLGALANAAAFSILALTLGRVFGFRSAWLYLCFIGMSLYSLWQSRVAWEVTALTLPLLALFLACVLPFWSKRNPDGAARPLAADFAVMAVCWIGVLSHIIFALAVAAFAGAALIAMIQNPNRDRVELAVLMAYTTALVPAVAIRQLAGALPQVLPIWAVSLLLTVGTPLLLSIVYAWTRPVAMRIAQQVAKTANAWLAIAQTRPSTRLAPIPLLGIALAPFLFLHSGPFVSVVSGLGEAQRMASVVPNGHTRVAILLLGAAVIGLMTAAMALAWRRCGKEDSPLKFLVLSALLSCVLLPAIVPGTSLRYYAIPHALLLIAAAAASATLLRRPSRLLLAVFTIAPAAVCAIALTEQARRDPRPPILFMLGPLQESSAHFLPIEPLIARLQANRSCKISARDLYEIGMPVRFMYRINPWTCDPVAICRVEYCLRGAQNCAQAIGNFKIECPGDIRSAGPAP